MPLEKPKCIIIIFPEDCEKKFKCDQYKVSLTYLKAPIKG